MTKGRTDQKMRARARGWEWRGVPGDERFRWALAAILIVGGVLLFNYPSLSATFVSEDWVAVGPPAVQRFLDDPTSLFRFFSGGHYNPVSRSFFTLESALFREHHQGYHAVGILLLSGLCLLLLHFLRSFGVGYLAALLAALCFALNWTNIHILAQVYNQHYFFLGALLLGSLLCYKAYLAGKGRRDLVLTAALVGTAQYVHSTAAIFPAILMLLLPFRWGGEGIPPGTGDPAGRREKARSCLLLWGLVLLLQGLPRLVFGAHIEGVGASPSLNIPGYAQTLWAVLWTWGVTIRFFLPSAAGWGLVALLAAAAVAWALRPRLLPLLLLGSGVLVLILAPPVLTLNWEPKFFASRLRYLFLPALGASIALAVLLDGLGRLGARGAAWAGKAAVGALVLLFLAGSFAANDYYYKRGVAQAGFVRKAAENYVKTARNLARNAPCGTIVIRDVPLIVSAPEDLYQSVLIQGLDHQALHRFYFALDRTMMRRFEFKPPPLESETSRGPCEFVVVDGEAL